MNDEIGTPNEIIKILNPDDGKTYTVILSAEDSQRVQNDLTFAQQLLKNIGSHHVNKEKSEEIIPAKAEESIKMEQDHIFWSYEATAELIKLFESKIDHLNNARKRKVVFGHIASQLGCTTEQVLNKWKSLIRSYRSSKEQKTKTGKPPARFLFFKEMDNLMSNEAVRNQLDSSESSDDSDARPAVKRIKQEVNEQEHEQAPAQQHYWSFEATIALLNTLEQYSEDILMLDNPRHRKHIFTDVANTLNNLGYSCSKINVQTKWKGLLRSFKSSKLHRQKTQRSAGRFMYFDEMNKLVGDKIFDRSHQSANDEIEFDLSDSSDSDTEMHSHTIGRKKDVSKASVSGTSQQFNWTYKTTLALIKSMKPCASELSSPRQRKNAFERVANELVILGYNCSQEDVRYKWDNLMRNYNSAKNKNDAGRGCTFSFVKEMDALFWEDKQTKQCLENKQLKGDTLRYLYEKEKNRQERHKEKMEIERKKISLLQSILEKLE